MNARSLLPLLLLTAWIPTAQAAQPRFRPPVAPDINSVDAGQALAEQLRRSVPEGDSSFTALLKRRAPDGSIRTIPVRGSIDVEGASWKQTYQTVATNGQPAQRLVIHHRPDQPNQYEFTSAASPTREPDLSQPLAGSDFWVVDLGMDFLHWPFQKLIRTEMRKSRVCHLLESLNPSREGYARVLVWLDKEKGQPLLAEAYDAQNNLLKEFSIGSVRKINGQWQVRDMKISNVQKGTRTELEFQFD